MKESCITQEDKPVWYENDQPIQEYLESYRKNESDKAGRPVEKPSWLKMIKKSSPR